jgi:hypothetical protein
VVMPFIQLPVVSFFLDPKTTLSRAETRTCSADATLGPVQSESRRIRVKLQENNGLQPWLRCSGLKRFTQKQPCPYQMSRHPYQISKPFARTSTVADIKSTGPETIQMCVFLNKIAACLNVPIPSRSERRCVHLWSFGFNHPVTDLFDASLISYQKDFKENEVFPLTNQLVGHKVLVPP